MSLPSIRYPDPPAHIEPYCEALGPELAIRFLIRFGGADLYLPKNPCGKSEAERFIGTANMKRLARHSDTLARRVPLGNIWLAAALSAEGRPVAEIARTLRASDITVRRWLRHAEARIKAGKRV